MLIFQRFMFMLLLASLQWPKSEAVNATSTDLTSSIKSTASTSTTSLSIVTSPAVTHHSETSAEKNDAQSNSITPRSPTQQPDFSKEKITQSFTSDNRKSSPSERPTTTSNLLTISESYVDTTYTKPSEAVPNSFTTTTDDVSFTKMISPNDAPTNGVTVSPSDDTSATLLATSNNAKTVLMTNVQTTGLHPKFTDNSAESREPKKEDHSNGGVIFGAIVGAVLGSALIGLVGYFMCAKRKSEGFVHQRLYDDTRSDPVLRLDNESESYGAHVADLSYYNPMMANETMVQNSNARPYDAIPMDDMTSSPHSS
ncbi:mucin-15 [Eublepharis macularius]|uniref:Mucin-15 n=1 Tax=Eublepharis macularius TaxID=481883 RepID=A0AA97KSU0_EUBMA|nr:mucin-15 [Eublepharis macularius]